MCHALQATPGPDTSGTPAPSPQPPAPGTSTPQLPRHSDWGPTPSCLPGQFVPVLLIDHLSRGLISEDDGVEWLAWGGGPAYLLAAATSRHIHFFSLRHFFTREAAGFIAAGRAASAAAHAPVLSLLAHTGIGYGSISHNPAAESLASQPHALHPSTTYTTAGVAAGLPLPSSTWAVAASYRLGARLLAMDWTQRGDGVLLSDAAHAVTMLEVQVEGVDSVYVVQGGLPSVIVREAWSAKSDAPHPLAAAGLGPGCPSATAHTRTVTSSSGGPPSYQHRVIVWWPRPLPPAQLAATAAAAATASVSKTAAAGGPRGTPQGAAGAGRGAGSTVASGPNQGTASDGHAPESSKPLGALGSSETAAAEQAAAAGHAYTIGAEVVRHPVRVVALQWSPPLGGERDSSTPQGSTSTADAAPSSSSTAVAAGGSSSPSSAPSPQPAAAPSLALMTVGADGAIRIWVEVMMKDLLPASMLSPQGSAGGAHSPGHGAAAAAAAAATAAALSLSQFCLALVIDPPLPSITPGVWPGLRAAWARPLLPPAFTATQGTAGGSGTGGTWSSDGGGGVTAGGGPGSSGSAWSAASAATAITSRVHWVVASMGVVVAPGGTGAAGGSGVVGLAGVSGGGTLEEAVCVWAVDGLGGAALTGLPRGAVAASRGAAGPRAVLWGRDTRTAAWLQPHEVACAPRDTR